MTTKTYKTTMKRCKTAAERCNMTTNGHKITTNRHQMTTKRHKITIDKLMKNYSNNTSVSFVILLHLFQSGVLLLWRSGGGSWAHKPAIHTGQGCNMNLALSYSKKIFLNPALFPFGRSKCYPNICQSSLGPLCLETASNQGWPSAHNKTFRSKTKTKSGFTTAVFDASVVESAPSYVNSGGKNPNIIRKLPHTRWLTVNDINLLISCQVTCCILMISVSLSLCTLLAASLYWGVLETSRWCHCRGLAAYVRASSSTNCCTRWVSTTNTPGAIATSMSESTGKTSMNVRIPQHPWWLIDSDAIFLGLWAIYWSICHCQILPSTSKRRTRVISTLRMTTLLYCTTEGKAGQKKSQIGQCLFSILEMHFWMILCLITIVHICRNAFAKTGSETITPIPDASVPIGQRDGLSDIDIIKINKLYKCWNYLG